MILLVTYLEKWVYGKDGKQICKLSTPVKMVSHGVDVNTSQNVCLPVEELYNFKGALEISGEWYIM